MLLTIWNWAECSRLQGSCAAIAIVIGLLPAVAFAQDAEPKKGSITGVVTDAESGAVVPEVEVRMVKSRSGGGLPFPLKPTRVRTDSSGRYQFENLEPGEYHVYAFHGSKASRTKVREFAKTTVADDGTSTPVDLKLTEGLTLRVSVVEGETGKPIRGAHISLRSTDVDKKPITNDTGVAEIACLTPQDQHVEAKADGYELTSVTQTLKDRVTKIQFKLAPGGSIQGTIVDDNGKPLAGASISASPERGSTSFDSVKSDENGKFTLNYVPISQSMRIYASLKDHQSHFQSFSLNGAPYRPLEITLPPRPHGGDVDVTVTDAEGRPIAGAEVTNYGSSSSDYHRVKTDDSGHVLVSKLYLGFNQSNPELSLSAEGFAAKMVQVEPSKDSPAKLAVTLEKGHRFRGRIVNAAGEPVTSAMVYFNDGNRGFGGVGGRLIVDKQGRIASTSLQPDSTLNVSARGYTPQERVKIPLDQDEEHIIKLEPTGRFRGVVANAKTKEPVRRFNIKLGFARNPPAGVAPTRSMPSDWGETGRTISDEAGRLLWEELPNNTGYDLIVEAEGFETTRLASAVTGLAETELRIELQPIDPGSLVEVAGAMLDPKGDPIEGIVVHLIGVDPAMPVEDPNGRGEVPMHLIQIHQSKNIAACKLDHETTTAADGRFRFQKASNKFKLQLVYWGENTPGTRVRDLEKQTADQLRQLEVFAPLGVTIKGTIDLKRYPKPGSVTARAPSELFDSRDARFKAGEDRSKFTIRGLPAGEISIVMMSEPVTRRENGSTFYTSSPIADKTVVAKPGETIEVKFE